MARQPNQNKAETTEVALATAQEMSQTSELTNQQNLEIQKVLQDKQRLESELGELKEMVKLLLESKTKSVANQEETKEFSFEDDLVIADDIPTIDPHKPIPVTNFTKGGMTLKANDNKRFRFEGFGMSRTITFIDLQDVVNNHPSFAREIAFFIHDEDARKALYLADNYKANVNKKVVENFIMLDITKMESFFKSLSNTLQETVIDFVIDGVKEGSKREYLDRNKIVLLEQLSGKPIYKIVNDSK